MDIVRRPSKSGRQAPRAGDICVGAIVWLPPKETSGEEITCCCPSHISSPNGLEQEGYNHPAVVLKVLQKPGSRDHGDLVCHVAFITSFDSYDLKMYARKPDRRVRNSIPIFHSKSGPPEEDVEQLHLESGDLDKQSYVRTSHMYPVHITTLWSFWRPKKSRAYKTRLTKEGYLKLMKRFGVDAAEYEPTKQVRTNSQRRLRILANPQASPPATIPVPISPPTIEPVRRQSPPAISAVDRAILLQRYLERQGYGTTAVPARQYPPPVPPVYIQPVRNSHSTYYSYQDGTNYQGPQVPVRTPPQYTYQQQPQYYGRNEDSSGNDDCSGIAIAVTTFMVIFLIISYS